MRRNAVTLLASLFLVSMLFGCAGKKKDAMADGYDPSAEMAAPADNYAAYPSGGTYTGATAGSRYHTVQKKETLYALARQYYNDQGRWKDIYEANRAEIGSDPSRIRVGQRLVIP